MNSTSLINNSTSLIDNYTYKNINLEYRIEPNPIGSGSFATVYLGYDDMNKKVAIKRINLNKLNGINLRRVTLELNIFKSLEHKNILRYFDTFKTKNSLYIVSEYCEAGTLNDIINTEVFYNLDINEKEIYVKKILIQLKDALKYLHDNGIIHRDLKPANILFTKDTDENLVLKLADFGFARYFNTEIINVTGYQDMISTICGSPLYMAPELLISSKYNLKADLWSFGVIMYEMLYGCNPYTYNGHSAKNVQHLCELIKNKKVSYDIYDSNKSYSTDCIHLIKKLLEIDPIIRISWIEFFYDKWFDINDEIDNLQTESLYGEECIFNFDEDYFKLQDTLIENKKDNILENNILTDEFQMISLDEISDIKNQKEYRETVSRSFIRIFSNSINYLQNISNSF